MVKSIVTREVTKSKNRVVDTLAREERAIDTIRLVYCESDASPDSAFFQDDRVNSSLRFNVDQCKREGGLTTFFLAASAEVASSEKRKKPAWKLDTTFFVAVTHDPTLSIDMVKEFLRATALPAAMMRFTSFMESVAEMAGIPISSFAANGMSFPDLDFDLIENESKINR